MKQKRTHKRTQKISILTEPIYFPNSELEKKIFDLLHDTECEKNGTEECQSCIGRQILFIAGNNPDELRTFINEYRREIVAAFGRDRRDRLLKLLGFKGDNGIEQDKADNEDSSNSQNTQSLGKIELGAQKPPIGI